MITTEQFVDVLKSMYPSASQLLHKHTDTEILQAAADLSHIDPQRLANFLMGGFGKGKTNGAYAVVLSDLTQNIDRYDWVYEHLEDERSRFVFSRLIHYRLFPDPSILKDAYDGNIPQYFDPDIVSCSENEVFVDCGGYIGDISESFIRSFGAYHAIHVYEPDPENIVQCRTNLAPYKNIFLHHAGVGEHSEKLSFDSSNSASSFVSAAENAEKISVISLDEDITDPVTFIKMDVEGFEIPALLGAKEHIRKDCPKLAICTYHIVSDLWEIPMLIHAINPNYKFYFRHYHEEQNWEPVLYAIPMEQYVTVAQKSEKTKRILALASDPNSGWMDRIEWANPDFQKFMDCCDVIGASGHKIQKHLNEKWPWKIRYLPNGYYNFANPGCAVMPEFTKKKNVILSVSRLGTHQKATDVLMNSFARIADQLPDWVLRLVGPVADDFQPFIEKYFEQYPHLCSRVQIAGMVVDRVELQKEFETAKVYAMPSRWEGGAPNVISQALTGGCAMAVTKFDDWSDCIDSGRCGVVTDIDDVVGFSEKLLELCQSDQLETLCRNAFEYGVKNYDTKKIVDHIYTLLFGGEE